MTQDPLVLSLLTPRTGLVELVERKGIGHPDTICDALAENLARNLSRYYRDNFGQILHHNVDKALLCGGQSMPVFAGGNVTEPFDIYLAGRATSKVGDKQVPLEDLAIEGSKTWLRDNLRYLDVDKHVRLHCKVRPGSAELVDVFDKSAGGTQLANDTSFGVGYAPLSPTEQLVLSIDRERVQRPAHGEDTKIMVMRNGPHLSVTLSCAMVGAHIPDLTAYLGEKQLLVDDISSIANRTIDGDVEIFVNTADDVKSNCVFLTVTGTSAEAGDDGQVGRGNRINGLITPYRPMSLEAAAGKNSITHVGKLYNIAAGGIATAMVAEIDTISAAQCILLSRIGQPVDQPAVVDIKLTTVDGSPVMEWKDRIKAIVADELEQLKTVNEKLIRGEIRMY